MLNRLLAKISFNEKHREMLYKTIADYVSSGLGVSQYIYKSRKRYEKDKDVLFVVYNDIYTRMSSGATLSEAFEGFVPNDELAIITSVNRASDKAVANIFENLYLLVEKKRRISKSIMNFDLGLSLLLVIITPVVLLQMANLVKNQIEPIRNMLSLNRLPSVMQFVYNDYIPFLLQGWYLIYIVIGVIFVSVYLAVLYLPNSRARRVLDKSALFIPFYIFATYKSFIFLVTAGVYNRSGFDISTYVKDMYGQAQPYEKSIYSEIIGRLDSGSYTAGEALSIGWLPKEIEYRLEDYALSNEFGFVIAKITDQMIGSICDRLTSIMGIVRWISVIMFLGSFGLIVGLLYSLSSAIG
jgi:hypothetical protein